MDGWEIKSSVQERLSGDEKVEELKLSGTDAPEVILSARGPAKYRLDVLDLDQFTAPSA